MNVPGAPVRKAAYPTSLFACLLAGAAMLAVSFRYPWYRASRPELLEISAALADKPRDVRFREWHEETKRRETPRKTLHDVGVGLMSLAVVLGLLYGFTGFPSPHTTAPKSKWRFIALYLGALAVQVPAAFYYYAQRQDRFEYPPWGDSIIIGIFQTVLACAFLAVAGTVLWLPFLWRSKFPARLFAWPVGQTRFNAVVTTGCIVFVALCLFGVVFAILDGSIGGVVTGTVLAYLFLVMRAGLVGYHAGTTTGSAPPAEPDATGDTGSTVEPRST
jgi:hypothetical protein